MNKLSFDIEAGALEARVLAHTVEPTMSSLQFAEILKDKGTRHDSIKRTMETLSNQGVIQQLTQSVEVNHRNQKVQVYHVNERDSYVVMAQLSPEFTARLVDEWQKLKSLTREQKLAEAVQLSQQVIAEKDEEIKQVTYERDEAVRTKAHVQSKRDATCFALTGRQAQEINRLKRDLDIKENYMTTKAVPWVKEYFYVSPGMWTMLGKALAKLGREMDYTIHETKHPKYPTKIKLHHQDVVEELREILDEDLDPYHLGQFRKRTA